MFNRQSVLTGCRAILGLVLAAVSANASTSVGTATYLTFSGPVCLPGVTLEAGTYLFELASSVMDHDIVRVTNKERTVVHFTGFTEQVSRPAGLPAGHRISFGEAQAGAAPPITAWFPTGDSVGHRFIYRTPASTERPASLERSKK